jgi:hypothetical protein
VLDFARHEAKKMMVGKPGHDRVIRAEELTLGSPQRRERYGVFRRRFGVAGGLRASR